MDTLRDLAEMELQGTRYSILPYFLRIFFLMLIVAGLGLTIIFAFGVVIRGQVLIEYAYYWLFISIFLICTFMLLPARKKDVVRVPWYDYLAMVIAGGASFYNLFHAYDIALQDWYNVTTGVVVLLAILEGARRGAGNIYFAVTLFIATYPLFADYMPGIFWGVSFPLEKTLQTLVFTSEGLLGLPTKVMGEFLVGFLAFAAVLISTGGGEFFLRLANCLVGKYRGGPAKVAVVASSFFGMLSGSAVSNVAGTGSFTIPTMKRIGYPPHYAGAIEACASTGGTFMPPVMGAVAFIMAEFLGIEYGRIIIAAAIPAILYYLSLLIQVDAFAAKVNLVGLPKEEIPSLKQTLKEGWPFISVIVFLTWGLVYMRWERLTPWYASALLILLSFYRRETWPTPKRLLKMLLTVGAFLTKTVPIVLPVGFIVAGLTVTGVSGSFTSGLIDLGMGNIFLVLLLGVIACYIMGMAGMVTAAYVFLAVTLAPAVLKIAPLNEMAVHLFIIYWAMYASITPPVATAVFVASAIAGSPPMKTGMVAVRLALVSYFIPFFFVFKPALILQGPLLESIYLTTLMVVCIVLAAGGTEGYLLLFGKVDMWARPLFIISGLLIGFPEFHTSYIGAGLAIVTLTVTHLMRRRKGIKLHTMR